MYKGEFPTQKQIYRYPEDLRLQYSQSGFKREKINLLNI
jgi:hypothetical protein